ncbi:hypothetical protein WT08_19905 [Burkholderia sp. MSMB1552]|nr:hypothetical protein WT08_19905 [Burkholderia sp. MSMB1552]KWZ50031.1 hypothetical protein WS92_21480 [Burkholderia sp. MSMB1588]
MATASPIANGVAIAGMSAASTPIDSNDWRGDNAQFRRSIHTWRFAFARAYRRVLPMYVGSATRNRKYACISPNANAPIVAI